VIRRALGIKKGDEFEILIEANGGFNRTLRYMRLERVI
jgi:bifunctional DNA-binding transcriptional regulator/antitoxin component of YhaV-PrlF toxin-antitoxin module